MESIINLLYVVIGGPVAGVFCDRIWKRFSERTKILIHRPGTKGRENYKIEIQNLGKLPFPPYEVRLSRENQKDILKLDLFKQVSKSEMLHGQHEEWAFGFISDEYVVFYLRNNKNWKLQIVYKGTDKILFEDSKIGNAIADSILKKEITEDFWNSRYTNSYRIKIKWQWWKIKGFCQNLPNKIKIHWQFFSKTEIFKKLRFDKFKIKWLYSKNKPREIKLPKAVYGIKPNGHYFNNIK